MATDYDFIIRKGNLGVGTASPSTKLDVRYDDGVSSGEHNVLASFSRNGTGPLVIGYRADWSAVYSALIRIGDGLPLTIGTTSANQAITLLNNGNVGIGTTNPQTTLDVNGTIKTGGNGGGYVEGYRIIFETPDTHRNIGSNAYQIESITSQGLTIGYASNQFVVVNPSGSVGIGTTSPGAKLHVSGAISASSINFGQDALNYYDTEDAWVPEINTSNNNISGITCLRSIPSLLSHPVAQVQQPFQVQQNEPHLLQP